MAHRRRFAAGAGALIVAAVTGAAFAAGGASGATQGGPTAETDPASNITSTSAKLNGVAGPGFKIVLGAEPGQAATYVFHYGANTGYGSQTATGIVTTTQSVSASVAELTPCTTYHFRIVASEAGSTTDGADMTFTTASDNPDLAVKAPKRATHGRRFVVALTLASPAHLTISVTHRGRTVKTVSEGLRQVGAFTARIRAPRKAGRYGLRIVASGDCATQTVRRRLRVR